MKNRQFIFFTKHDVLLILIICTLATILNMYANPYLAAAVVVGGILLMRIVEHREAEQKETENTIIRGTQTVEKRSAKDIVVQKLEDGAIEKAIDEKFDKMLNDVVDDLFGQYGDVSRTIKAKLKENMNKYVEAHDFSQYNIKLEHLLNQLVEAATKDQRNIIQHTQQLIGLPPVDETKTSDLFDKFAEYIAMNIDTSKLEINTDDEISYENITGRMTCEDVTTFSDIRAEKRLTFTCDEDENMGAVVTLQRWTEGDKPWVIANIHRFASDDVIARNKRLQASQDITSLQTPITNLRELTDFEIYLLKLYYDNTSILIDEDDIEDEGIEIDEKPEPHFI